MNIAIATDTNGSSQDTAAKATSIPSPLRKLIRFSAVVRGFVNYINKVYLSDTSDLVLTCGLYGPMTSQPQNIKAINKINIHTANLRILGSASLMVISKTCKGELMYKDMYIKNFQGLDVLYKCCCGAVQSMR